ncbi:MAG: DUF92 domain-containing protein [Myxococcales bacterium]|nr:DUF92 domain-containing protein [Myxococcales bacterium]
MADLVLGLALSGAIAWLARRRGSLSNSGALAALGVGAAIYVGGGPRWFAALIAFFLTSTLLGRVGSARKAAVKREFSKGDTRDAWQVLANGGLAAALALVHGLLGIECAAAFVGALATATGDTWATELGTLARRPPFSLLTLRRVPVGSSGAVSALGLGATAAGGALVGAIVGGPAMALVGAIAGAIGALVDSLAGATLQASYICPRCVRRSEAPRHHCGAEALRAGGVAWIGNDAVNLLATAAGALVGAALGG